MHPRQIQTASFVEMELRGLANNIICSFGDLLPESQSYAFQAWAIHRPAVPPLFRIMYLTPDNGSRG